MLSDHENVFIESSQVPVWVEMGTWPLIKIKVEHKDVGVKKWFHLNSLLQEDWEVLVEQVTIDEVVLVLHDILNDD